MTVSGSMDEEKKYSRALCSFKSRNDKFLLKERRFNLQYAQLYALRLMATRKKVAAGVRRSWGNSTNIKKLSELKLGEECCLIGTLFKKMELQPSILKDLSEDTNTPLHPPQEKYIEDADELILEDETQRVSLCGNIDTKTMVTGTILAVIGQEGDRGKFVVRDFCFSGLPFQSSPDLDCALSAGEDRFVILTSGFNIGDSGFDPFLLQLFVDYVSGFVGSEEDNSIMSKVCRVIVAGNSLGNKACKKENDKLAKYLSRNTQASSVGHIRVLDDFLAQLGVCVPVTLMPGEHDPSNHFLPQQSLHGCMFPKSTAHAAIDGSTNPLEAVIGGRLFLGTSGQNISNIEKFSAFESRLDILEMTLQCGHIAPTCPDTLSCYPYYSEDPFILSECPHVYFAGNQPSFNFRKISGESKQTTLLVTVPSFIDTNQVVLLNLRTLECKAIQLITLPSGKT